MGCPGMADSNIVTVLARAYVDDIDAALPLYRSLTGEQEHRFTYGPMSLASVGQFILVQGAGDDIRAHTATIAVRDMASAIAAIEEHGGSILEGPDAGPNGARAVARHGDGTIVEYIELG